ncbi:MAG: RNA polymerase sigma factor [Myxococcota bacterium]
MRETEPSAALLRALHAGDPSARGLLVELWGPAVLRWCARIGGPRIDAEDAAHDVFERVLASVHHVREPRALSSWMFQTTRRVVADRRRRGWLRWWVPGLVPEVRSPSPGPALDAETAQLAARVREALDVLPAELREVLVLCEMEDRDGTEVAALLDVPLGTVKSRLRRARERFEAEAVRRGIAPDRGSP